jgi:hypothetical protein
VNRTVKFGLVAVVVLGVVAAPLAYRHRHSLHSLLHRIKNSLIGSGGGGSLGGSSAPVVKSLDIGGKKFTDVLGYPPYYLTVTQFDAVLFVTRLNNGGTNLFHVLNLKTGQEEQIPSIADFGRNIGSAGGGMRDYIERVAPGEVVVASESSTGWRVKSEYRLDLQAGIVDTRKVFYYDQNGQITNVYEGPGF